MTGASDTPAPMGEDDLVARLRDSSAACVEGSAALAKRKPVLSGDFMLIGGLFTKAADRITTLEARLREAEATIGELREGLRPFAEVGEALTAQGPTDRSPWATAHDNTPYANQGLTFGDLRRARTLLKDTDHAE